MQQAVYAEGSTLNTNTNYFNEQDVIKFKINNTGEYTGIGAMITRKEDKLIVREPYKGYPADKAGLKAGDEIFQIVFDLPQITSQLLTAGFEKKWKRSNAFVFEKTHPDRM
jgi:C-terminal processing protease CtpA/Prc